MPFSSTFFEKKHKKKKKHADAIILMQVMVLTTLGAVPLTHQAFLLPLASLRAEITRSKRSTLSALVKASTSTVQCSTSCLKTHYRAWISMRGVFTWTTWGYFRMAVQKEAMENARPSSRKKLQRWN